MEICLKNWHSHEAVMNGKKNKKQIMDFLFCNLMLAIMKHNQSEQQCMFFTLFLCSVFISMVKCILELTLYFFIIRLYVRWPITWVGRLESLCITEWNCKYCVYIMSNKELLCPANID